MKALLLLFLLFVSPALPATEVFLARCTEVIDGDTIEVVKADGSGVRIRIEGIDCPEGNQAFGDKATDFAREQLLGKDLKVISKTTDRYGRLVARLYDEAGAGLSANRRSLLPIVRPCQTPRYHGLKTVWQMKGKAK